LPWGVDDAPPFTLSPRKREAQHALRPPGFTLAQPKKRQGLYWLQSPYAFPLGRDQRVKGLPGDPPAIGVSQARCFPGQLKHAGRPSPVWSASPLYAYAVISNGPQELVCPGGLMMRHPSP
jgi:hypothetical protein